MTVNDRLQHPSAMPRPRGFTLIELLVTIAIIAILVAILFPVFASARVAARKAACGSNMRQIGMALGMYADDYDGFMPITSHDLGPDEKDASWIFSLKPYVANTDEIRICPADPARGDRLKYDGSSYILNDWIAGFGPGTMRNLHQLPRPAETFTTFIVSDKLSADWSGDHVHARTWFYNPATAWAAILNDIQPDRHRPGVGKGTGPDRTQGVANYLYADGHVKAIPALRIKQWADQGFNFARPPLE